MKSFATSICPIKNPLAVNMRHPRAIPAPSQPGKSVFGTATLVHRYLGGSPAWRDGHPSALRHGDPAQR